MTKTYCTKQVSGRLQPLCVRTCLILFYAIIAIGRILPSIAGCSVVLETHQPWGSRKGFDVGGDEGDGILLRRDALEILPDEINEVYILEGPTTCGDISTKNEDVHRNIVHRYFVNVKIVLWC